MPKEEWKLRGQRKLKVIINGMNSAAHVFMADFEDAFSPTWANVLTGQLSLYQAVRQNLVYETENPHGLHLDEFHFKIRGQSVIHGYETPE